MINATNNESPIINTAATKDGVTIFLHANGEISNRLSFYRGRIADPVRAAEIFAGLAHVNSAEIPAFLRRAKGRK